MDETTRAMIIKVLVALFLYASIRDFLDAKTNNGKAFWAAASICALLFLGYLTFNV